MSGRGVERSVLNVGCAEVGTGQRELYSVPPPPSSGLADCRLEERVCVLGRSPLLSPGGGGGGEGSCVCLFVWNPLDIAMRTRLFRIPLPRYVADSNMGKAETCSCTALYSALLRDGRADRRTDGRTGRLPAAIAETSARSRNRVTSA